MYLFDTSALIGLTERGNVRSEALIEESDRLPLCHAVTLGELSTGVQRAEVDAPGDLALRQTTLAYAQRLPVIDAIDDGDIECFAVISTLSSRKLSHNDRWILAAAYVRDLVIVTEDELLHRVASDRALAEALGSHLGITPETPILT